MAQPNASQATRAKAPDSATVAAEAGGKPHGICALREPATSQPNASQATRANAVHALTLYGE
jgi:hypothetical protein